MQSGLKGDEIFDPELFRLHEMFIESHARQAESGRNDHGSDQHGSLPQPEASSDVQESEGPSVEPVR